MTMDNRNGDEAATRGAARKPRRLGPHLAV
jgi:hypothetical protein